MREMQIKVALGFLAFTVDQYSLLLINLLEITDSYERTMTLNLQMHADFINVRYS